MNDINNPIRLVREWKGAAISIMVALSFAGKNATVNQKWLEATTGYTDKPVSRALMYLVDTGWVLKVGRGWMIAGKVQQLPLMNLVDNSVDKLLHDEVSRNNSDLNRVNTFNNNNKENELPEGEQSLLLLESRKNSDSIDFINADSHLGTQEDDPAYIERYAALKHCGVEGDKRKILARRDDLDAVAILAWNKELKRRKPERFAPGLLIYVLEQKQELPRRLYDDMLIDFRYWCIDCGRFYECVCERDDDDYQIDS